MNKPVGSGYDCFVWVDDITSLKYTTISVRGNGLDLANGKVNGSGRFAGSSFLNSVHDWLLFIVPGQLRPCVSCYYQIKIFIVR
ncbi:hypothetical protein [Endozoicomonas acroporae]|uniref:hypothetical protein n=1 Tax=Endozoicomonas acroporae TaxID=1701104 RepID=UPI003D78C981